MTEPLAPRVVRSPTKKSRPFESVPVKREGTTTMEATMKRLRSERDEARTSLKALEASHAKATVQLSKHAKLLPTLQQKMEELSANHAESRKRKEAEIEREREMRKALQDKHDGVCGELKAAQIERRHLKMSLDGKQRQCDELIHEKGALKRLVSDLRQANETTASVASSHLTTLRAARETEAAKDRATIYELTIENARLSRQLADRISQLTLLATFCGEQQAQAELGQSMLDERDQDVERLIGSLQDERELRVKEKDWRQRARSDERMIAWQEDEIESMNRERVETLDQVEKWQAHRQQLLIESIQVQDRLLVGQDDVLEELKATNVELASMKAELDDKKQSLAETSHALSKLQEEHEALQVAHSNKVDQYDALVGTHEDTTRALDEERRAHDETKWQLTTSQKETEKERTEKKRLVSLLGMSRKATESLTRDLNEANDELDRLRNVDRDNGDLRNQVDTLARLQALAESELESVTAQNVDLLSHGNANQKIRHIAALRAELVDSKRAHVQTTSALKAARIANDELRRELEAYKPLDGRKSRATGPDMRDVASYYDDEKHVDEHHEQEQEEEEGGEESDDGGETKRRATNGPRRVVMFARRSQGPVKQTGKMMLSELL